MMKEIVCNNLSYSYDNTTIIKSLSIRIHQHKIGLIGSNGVGKTTLIRLLVGDLQPTAGSVFTNGTIGYLPQHDKSYTDESVATVLGVESKLQALAAIETGHASLQDIDMLGEDWNMRERLANVLKQVDLEYFDIARSFASLSGGEKTRILFARLLLDTPDFLVLDEPTNNLDQNSRAALYNAISSFDGGVLVVSHDRELLNYMDQIAELTTLGVRLYGGNYDAYREQQWIEQEALEQDVLDAQKNMKKTRRVVQESKEKHAQRASMGNRLRRSGAQPKILLDYKKGRAEVAKSKLEARTDKQLSAAREKLNTAKAKLEQKDFLDFNLHATRVPNGKVVLDLQHVSFAYPACEAIMHEFDLTIIGPERVAIMGNNGTGKSTLLKLIMRQLQPITGTITVGVRQVAYLDQNLSILRQDQTILENFRRLNTLVTESDCRTRLASFLFSQEMVNKPISCLSGGESMRAAMACLFMGDDPPQILLLDEPTNNMDLDSIRALESALSNYQGALLVVSHDRVFLENIGIDTYVHLGIDAHNN